MNVFVVLSDPRIQNEKIWKISTLQTKNHLFKNANRLLAVG